jgi:hypothetical protein
MELRIERERKEGWNLRYGDWKEREERGERGGRLFFVDDEKKLERFFSPWLAAEEKGKGREGKEQGEGANLLSLLACLFVTVTGALVTGKKYTVGR